MPDGVLTRSAQLGPATLDRGARRVDAVLSAGTGVRRRGPRPNGEFGDWIEMLDTAAVAPDRLVGRPVLTDHRPSVHNVVGKVVAARVEGSSIIGTIEFAEGRDVDTLIDKIGGGFISRLSIGYNVGRWEKVSNT